MRHCVLAAIRSYQRWISPYKGYRCAYRVHTGRAGCSALGYRAVRRYGVLRGLACLRARLHRCGEVYRRCSGVAVRAPLAQRGDCDPGCDAGWLDAAGLCDCAGCGDRGRRKRRARRAGWCSWKC